MSRSRRPSLLSVYRMLLAAGGHRGWWPAETQLEVVLGTILTQNTTWGNASRAVEELRSRGLLSLPALRGVPDADLARAIRPSGYFNQKAKRIRTFLDWLDGATDGSLVNLGLWEDARLRAALLSLNGVGPETADSILCYAFYRPVFVVDAYTRRIFSRHGYFSPSATYDQIQACFMKRLPKETGLLADYHAQIVHIGANWCRKTPSCATCPLGSLPFAGDRPCAGGIPARDGSP